MINLKKGKTKMKVQVKCNKHSICIKYDYLFQSTNMYPLFKEGQCFFKFGKKYSYKAIIRLVHKHGKSGQNFVFMSIRPSMKRILRSNFKSKDFIELNVSKI